MNRNPRMQDISHAHGWKEFDKHLNNFMKTNNFLQCEIKGIYHLLNSFYMLGENLEVKESK